MFLLAGFLASLIAWIINKYAFIKLGEKSVVTFTPIIEELLKTGLAIVLEASIIFTHIIFGSIEAVGDYTTSGKTTPACISLFSHAFLGIITHLSFALWGNIFLAIFMAYIVHFIWNKFVIAIVHSKK